MSGESERLFAYGTLQQREVQRALFARDLVGAADMLIGYRLEEIEIADPDVVDKSGKAVHLIAAPSGDRADRVTGTAFMLTSAELDAADRYETKDYARVETTLASGLTAWVYVKA